MAKADLSLVAQRFLKSQATYEANAQVQRQVGLYLLECLERYGGRGAFDGEVFDLASGLAWQRVLEIGCGTGALTEEMCRRWPVETLWVNDLVPALCEQTRDRVRSQVKGWALLPGDIETLTLPPDLTLILSASTFQWLQDLGGLFRRCADSLLPGGLFAFSLFGPGTFREIKTLLDVGLSYHSLSEVQEGLGAAFTCLHGEERVYCLAFEHPRQVLRHIQQTGVSGLGQIRWTKTRLQAFEKAYWQHYGDSSHVSLHYHALTVVARKR